jgi:hypothetical protein
MQYMNFHTIYLMSLQVLNVRLHLLNAAIVVSSSSGIISIFFFFSAVSNSANDESRFQQS